MRKTFKVDNNVRRTLLADSNKMNSLLCEITFSLIRELKRKFSTYDVELIEDITQEVILIVHDKIINSNEEIASLQGYAYKIGYNQFIKKIKKESGEKKKRIAYINITSNEEELNEIRFKARKLLQDEEIKLLDYYFSSPRKTQFWIAEKMNIKQPQVSDIKKRALDKMIFLCNSLNDLIKRKLSLKEFQLLKEYEKADELQRRLLHSLINSSELPCSVVLTKLNTQKPKKYSLFVIQQNITALKKLVSAYKDFKENQKKAV